MATGLWIAALVIGLALLGVVGAVLLGMLLGFDSAGFRDNDDMDNGGA